MQMPEAYQTNIGDRGGGKWAVVSDSGSALPGCIEEPAHSHFGWSHICSRRHRKRKTCTGMHWLSWWKTERLTRHRSQTFLRFNMLMKLLVMQKEKFSSVENIQIYCFAAGVQKTLRPSDFRLISPIHFLVLRLSLYTWKNIHMDADSFMKAAIDEARRGLAEKVEFQSVPVLVKDGKIVGRGHNQRVQKRSMTHAEIDCLKCGWDRQLQGNGLV